jgi:hypothetical protein
VQTIDDARLARAERAEAPTQRETESGMETNQHAQLERLGTLSRRLDLLGRALLHFSFEPLSFAFGVTSLCVHECLECAELGDAAAASASLADPLPPTARSTPWSSSAQGFAWSALSASSQAHVTATARLFQQYASGGATAASGARRGVHHQAHQRALGYLAKAVLLVPPLTRPFFWKVALGHLLAELGRDALLIGINRARSRRRDRGGTDTSA